MGTSMQGSRRAQGLSVSLVVLGSACLLARADPPATQSGAATASSDVQSAEIKGNFFSSLKQAFKQDVDREVVRGHFDVGTSPNNQRYYCLVDPKTGQREVNGVAGQLIKRRDGMTGIKGAVVAPVECADAERKGLLVTEGYVVKGIAASPGAVPSPPVRPAESAAVTPAAAPAVSAPAPVATAVAASAAPSNEVAELFSRYVDAQNAHDSATVSALLLDSPDFVLAGSRGDSVWGRTAAMETFEAAWKGTLRLKPQPRELRVASLSADAALLIAPMLLTSGATGEEPTTVRVRWAGVFVKTTSGWRIASILITPAVP